MSKEFVSHPVSSETRRLIHKSLDGPLTGEEVLAIQKALSVSEDARLWYSELIQLHAELASRKAAGEVCRIIQSEYTSTEDSSRQSTRASIFSFRRRLTDLIQWTSLATAATLMFIGVGLGCGVGLLAATIVNSIPHFAPVSWDWEVGNDVVAKVESTFDAKWQASESPETLPTRGLRVGQKIRLAEGLLKIHCRNGVGLILEGPAVYEIRSENGGKLFAGKLSATAPSDLTVFHVDTQFGSFQFGPGHFGVDVVDDSKTISLHALSRMAAPGEAAYFSNDSGMELVLRHGDSFLIHENGVATEIPLAASDEFLSRMPDIQHERFTENVVFLGNLFDDSKNVSLDQAMETDQYQAAAETIDLGVAAVHDGGLDVDVSLAEEGVMFNFANVGGGGPKVRGLPGNDTYRSVMAVPIRTTGEHFGQAEPMSRIEEGIGMSSNELLTFDLRELREAGRLGDVPMRFVVDRAGINDREDPVEKSRKWADVRLIVVVSSESDVISAHVDGTPFGVVEREGVYSIDLASKKLPPELRYDGRFVSFDVPIPEGSRFLTLATTMLELEHHDHAVFSGARLELVNSAVAVAEQVPLENAPK